mgnify:CR=1 FL=1
MQNTIQIININNMTNTFLPCRSAKFRKTGQIVNFVALFLAKLCLFSLPQFPRICNVTNELGKGLVGLRCLYVLLRVWNNAAYGSEPRVKAPPRFHFTIHIPFISLGCMEIPILEQICRIKHDNQGTNILVILLMLIICIVFCIILLYFALFCCILHYFDVFFI